MREADPRPAPAPKRILFAELNTDGTVGGSHTCLLELVEHMNREKFEPVVLFYQDNSLVRKFSEVATTLVVPAPTPLPPLGALHRLPKIAVLAITYLRKAINSRMLIALPTIAHARLLRRYRIDLVHLNNGVQVGLDWLYAARLVGARCIAHQRGDRPATRLRRSRHFDKVLCVSDQIRDELIDQDPALDRSAITIYDGVDVGEFVAGIDEGARDELCRELAIPPDTFLIGMVGNIKEWKGQLVVAQAFALIQAKASNAHLLFVGGCSTLAEDQAYMEDLQRFIENAGLSARVAFLGFREDAPSVMNAIDVIVHASTLPEPYGRVLLEAMALGKPVIATDHGGPREIIENGTSGFLVAPSNPKELARCLLDLINSSDLRSTIGRQALTRINTRFSTTQAVLEFEQIYSAVLDPPTAHRQASI